MTDKELEQARLSLGGSECFQDFEGDTMRTKQTTPKNIDEYIAGFPNDVQEILEKIRMTVREVAPEAKEKISYQIPAFTLDGDLIYFAAFKKHIGLYPPVKGDEKLRKELGPYLGGKGNQRFPLDEPIPYSLIRRVVKARVKEHRQKVASKQSKK